MNHKEQRATELKEKRPQAGYCGFYNRIIKRIIDFILSLIAAVAVTPIVFIIGIFVAIEDGFPVFYTPLPTPRCAAGTKARHSEFLNYAQCIRVRTKWAAQRR